MISQRLRGVREDGEAIEEAGFMPKLKSMFSEVGINVEDSNGELRSTYAILNDLSGVWDKLSSKQKQYFGEKVAGNRQVKTLNAIMQNWDVVADTIDKANEAQGAALEGNEMYMESIQGKITQLKSAFQELATATINSDFVKVFVDAGTAIVKFTTDLGGLTPILTTLLGLMTSFKGLKIAKGLKGIGDAFKLAFTPLKDSSNALGTLVSRIGIAVAAISVLATAYNKLKESSDAFNKIEKSQAKYADTTDEINNVQSKLSGVEQEINKIQSLGELSFVQEQELTRLQGVSAELQTQLDILKNMKEASKNATESSFSELMGNYQGRTSGNTVVDTVDMIKMLAGTWIEGISEGLAEDLNSGDWGAPDELLFREALSGFYNYQKNVKENNEKIVKSIEKGLEPIDLAGISDIENQRNEFKMESYKDLNKAYQIYSKYKKASEGVERNIFTESAFSILDEMESQLTQASNYAKTIDSSMEETFFGLFDNNKYDFNVVEEELLKLANAGQLTSEAFKNVNGIDSFIEYMDMLGVSVEDAIIYLNKYSDAQSKAIEQSNIKSNLSVGTSVDDVIKNMFQNTEFYSKNFSKMISEIEKSGSLSSGSVKDLLDQYPDVANYLQLTANGYTMTTEALHNFIEAQNEETKQNAVKGIMERQIAIEKLQKQIEELKGTREDLSEEEQKQIDDNNDIIKGYENEISQLKAVWLEANSAADALERYRTASKTANQDAEHTEGQGVLKSLQEAWKSGKIGTDDFKAGMDFFLGKNWKEAFEGDLQKAYQAASKIGEKYFGKDDQKNAENFRKALVDKGFATLDQKTGTLTMVKGSLTEIAEAFGISEAAAESLFGLLNSYSYGDQITFDKEITSVETLEAAIKELEQQQEAIIKQEEELSKYKEEHPEDVDGINERTEALNKQKEETEKLGSAIETAQKAAEGEFGNQEIFKMSLEEARAALVEITEAINVLNQNGITPDVKLTSAYYDLKDLIKLIDPKQGGGVEGQVSVDAEDEATPKISEVIHELAILDNEPTAKGEVDVDGDKEATDKVEDVISSVNSVTKEAKGTGSVDVEETEGFDDKLSDAQSDVENFDDVDGEAKLDADEKPIQDAVADAKEDIQTVTTGPGEEGKWIIQFGVSGEDDIKRISKEADEAAAKPRTIKYNVKQVTIDENGNEVAVGEGQVSGSGYYDDNGNFHGAVVSKQQTKTDTANNEDIDELTKKYNNLNNNLRMLSATPEGERSAEVKEKIASLENQIEELNKTIKDKKEENKKSLGNQPEEENKYPVQPWQQEKGPTGSNAVDDGVELEDVVDGDSLKVTITDDESNDLPDKYKKEIDEQAEKAILAKDSSWFGRGGRLDLNNRPLVPYEKTREKGYDTYPGDISTILSSHARIGEKGEIGIVLTPILPNGEVIEPGKLDELLDSLYADYENKTINISEKVDGVEEWKDLIVSILNLSNIPEQYWDTYLEYYTEKLHEVQEAIYAQEPELDSEIEQLGDKTEQVEIEYVEENKPDVDKVIEDAQDTADERPIQIEYDISTDAASKAVDELIDQADSSGILNYTDGKNAADQLTTALNNLHEAEEKVKDFNINGGSVDEATKAATGLKSAADKFMYAYKILSTKISTIQTVNITANTQQAIDKINKLSETPITVNIEGNINKIKLGDKTEVPPYANGTKSSKKGLALVDDGNGPELIEHKKSGTYEIGTNDGPRFTKLDKGDVVHTAEETKKILSRNGNIGSFFKNGLNKTKSIIGNAFAGGGIFGSVANSFNKVTNALIESAKRAIDAAKKATGIDVKGSANYKGASKTGSTNGNSNKSNATTSNTENDLKDFESYTKKLFDWIEIKLDKINQKTQDYIKKAKDAIRLTNKNNGVDKAIKQTEYEKKVNQKAAKKYQQQADKIAQKADLGKEIINRIKNGTLEISEYDDSVQKKIQEYQKWYEKAEACKKAVKELTDQEKELAKQKLDNIADFYSGKLENIEREQNKITANRDLNEAKGKKETEKSYQFEIDNISNWIKTANKEKDKLEKELKSLMKKRLVKKGDDTYREYKGKIADLEIEAIQKRRERIETKDAKRQLKITRSEYRADSISNTIDRKKEKREISEANGTFGLSSTEKFLRSNLDLLKDQNKEYDIQIKLYKEQQNGLDKSSKKYQEIEKAIRQVESAQNANTQAVIEYEKALNRIDITKLEIAEDKIQSRKRDNNYIINYKNKTGKELNKLDYDNLISDNTNLMAINNGKASVVQTEMLDLIKNGTKGIKGKKKTQMIKEIKSSKEYRDLQKEYDSYINENLSLSLENIDLEKQKRELSAVKLQYKVDNRQRRSDAIRRNIEQGTEIGSLSLTKVSTGEAGQNQLIKNQERNIENYKKQKQIYQDMIKSMDKLSPEYQELADKIASLDDAEHNSIITIQNLKDEMSDATFTLLKDDYDKLTDSADAFNDEISIKLAKGLEITKDSYIGLINNGNAQIANLQKQKKQYEQLMIGLDKNSEKYIEYAAAVRGIDSSIRDITESTIGWQKEIDKIDLTKLQWAGESLDAEKNRLEKNIDLKNATGKAITTGDYNQLIKNDEQRKINLEQINLLLKNQQSTMDKNSEEWQRIQREIEQNKSAITDINIEQEKYADSISNIKLDELTHSYDQIEQAISNITKNIDYNKLVGKELNESNYKNLIDLGNRQINNLKERAKLTEYQMKGLDVESEKYKELESKLNQLNNQIIDTTTSTAQWKKELYQLKLDRLGWQLDELTAKADNLNDAMSLHKAQKIDESINTYTQLIENGMERINVLIETNKALKEEQKTMDKNSEEYQNIEKQIQSNLKTINGIKVSQEEWNDSILDLDIEKLQKYKDALSKNNDQYKKQKELEEAILNLEKARSQKTVRTYRENVGFVYEANEEAVKDATKSLEDVVQNQLLDRIDDLINALESSKEDTNVYDANGNLIGTKYNTPQLGNLSNVLSNYFSKNNAIIDINGLKDSLSNSLVKAGGVVSNAQKNMSLDIGSIIVNEANDGNELAKAIVGQFPNALLQALYKK